jgi:hypothetical protein
MNRGSTVFTPTTGAMFHSSDEKRRENTGGLALGSIGPAVDGHRRAIELVNYL